MPALRTINCPNCGKRHFIGTPCSEAGGVKPAPQKSLLSRLVASLIIFMITALVLTAVALAVAESSKMGYGLAIVIGAWAVVQLFRLGYEWDDGIDVRQLIFPSPFDWPVKVERTIHFWTSPQPWFRAIYLGTTFALIIVVIVIYNRGRP